MLPGLIKSRIVANNILPIFVFGFIIINMDKLKKCLKHLFAPAIVLLLVVIMGMFSPVASVAVAVQNLQSLYIAAAEVATALDVKISRLPERTVKVETKILHAELPAVDGGTKKLFHAGKEIDLDGDVIYKEVGQYEWRFYTSAGDLYNTYTVTVTDSKYTMTMPSNVVTVAPKSLNQLKLPLPATYTVDGKTMEVANIEASTDTNHFAVVTLKKDKDDENETGVKCRLSATVALENDTFADNAISIDDKNVTIDLNGYKESTGKLKVTYFLSNESDKLLVAVPLTDIEIKNVNKSDVAFANIPTAPSVSNLSYCSTVALTAPSADSAKVGTTTFSVEAQTSIVKVQAYLFSTTEPSNWLNNSNVVTLTLNSNGEWTSSNNQYSANDIIEIDGLNVKVKALGWYRFQFETSTLFGYQMDSDFNNYDAIEQDSAKSYVRYWGDSIRIYRDTVEPNFAWVKDYDLTNTNLITDYNKHFSDHLNDYSAYLPMTEKPGASTSKKITVNYKQGLTLPAIFPHDNATDFDNIDVEAFTIKQIQNADGDSVADSYNKVMKGETATSMVFEYDKTKHIQISFQENGIGSANQQKNNVILKAETGLYQVSVTVREKQPSFLGDNLNYSNGYAQPKTKYLYFYVTSDTVFDCGAATNTNDYQDANSPVIDEENAFQVSDVYLWEGHTFDFIAPSYSDTHTPTDDIQVDYYLVKYKTKYEVVSKLDYTANASRVTVDLDKLDVPFDTIEGLINENYSFYIYAVARNFNGMQANLKEENGVTLDSGNSFDTDLFDTVHNDKNQIAQYGYAWKRAEFALHKINDAETATVDVHEDNITAEDGKFNAGKTIYIDKVSVDWGTGNVVDGQLSVAVYLVKADNVLVPYDVRNQDGEIISAVAFNREDYKLENLTFVPGVRGDYILVASAKDNASAKVFTKVTKITIGSGGSYGVAPYGESTSDSAVPDKTILLGENLTLPNRPLTLDKKIVDIAKNRLLLDVENPMSQDGNYTVTLMGISDPNCMTGNKFTPNKTGTYTFRYDYFLGDENVYTYDYIVQVQDANSSANILMGEDYDADEDNVLWVVGAASDSEKRDVKAAGRTYDLGDEGTGTVNTPAYAITLDQFVKANYGERKDFSIDSALLYQYLEPINKSNEISGYMYPAIAIPMPNVISDGNNSGEVEITVQKSGSSTYLVSSKKMNAGGSSNKESVIGKIGGYYVFRPEGTFKAECKDPAKYNAQNYLTAAESSAAGVYTVTYKTSTSSVSYNITIGNLQKGELNWKKGENFLTYNNGKADVEITASSDDLVIDKDSDGHRYITIDMSKVEFNGNEDMKDIINRGPNEDGSTNGINPDKLAVEYYWKNVTVRVTWEGTSLVEFKNGIIDETDGVHAIANHDEFLYKFDLSKGSGTYKVEISMTNSYAPASPCTASVEFTLDADATNKRVNLNTVWGVILIVLSVGLLAGVIFYFVKTARATRFVDAPRAIKGKEKDKTKDATKEASRPVVAPKDGEAPKKDAK